MADLPVTVKFVSHFPQPDVVGSWMSGGNSHSPIPVVGTTIAIADPIGRFFRRSIAGVHGQLGTHSYLAAEGHELMRAEFVRLNAAPGCVAARRTLPAGSDSILPMVSTGEVAAGPSHYWDVPLLCFLQYVLVHAIDIVGREQLDPGDIESSAA